MPEPIKQFFRRGGVVSLAVFFLALGLLTYLGLSSSYAGKFWSRTRIKRPDPLPPTAQELAVTLDRLGLDAASLTAAGLSPSETTSLVGRVSTDLQSRMQSIRDADREWGAERAEVDRLERLVRSGLSTEQDRAALATANTNLATAAATRQGHFDAVVTAAIDGLSGEQAAALGTMRTNHAQWDLPTQFLAGSHQEPGWVSLRDALANDRISTAQNTDPDPASHQVIVSALADPNVSAAASNLTSNLADVTAAWNAAVFQ
jgi:hypothetical protein